MDNFIINLKLAMWNQEQAEVLTDYKARMKFKHIKNPKYVHLYSEGVNFDTGQTYCTLHHLYSN